MKTYKLNFDKFINNEAFTGRVIIYKLNDPVLQETFYL